MEEVSGREHMGPAAPRGAARLEQPEGPQPDRAAPSLPPRRGGREAPRSVMAHAAARQLGSPPGQHLRGRELDREVPQRADEEP